MASPYTVAESMLPLSSKSRHQGGMQSTSAPPGPNAWDGSPLSNPASTTNQEAMNQQLAIQNVEVNTRSAIPQAGAEAIGDVRKAAMAGSDQQFKAQEFANERLATMLYANEQGSAMMKLDGVMNGPDKAAFEKDIAMGKMMAMGLSPDLAGA